MFPVDPICREYGFEYFIGLVRRSSEMYTSCTDDS